MLGAGFKLNKALVLRPIRHAMVMHGTPLISPTCDPRAIDFDANLATLRPADLPKN
jgi:hypothetical protein